jgi:site-specific recombinase XerC
VDTLKEKSNLVPLCRLRLGFDPFSILTAYDELLAPPRDEHSFATTLLDKGNDLKTVQALMGHSHIRTTEKYLHSTDDRKVEAIRSLRLGA